MRLLSTVLAIAACCTSASGSAQGEPRNGARADSVAAVEARAQTSINADAPEQLTPDMIRARLDMTLRAAVADGRRPDPVHIPRSKPMTIEEIWVFVAKQNHSPQK